MLNCCHTWNHNKLLASNTSMVAVEDSYPVRPGHALVIPKRHILSIDRLSPAEGVDLLTLIRQVYALNRDTTSFTVAINDGVEAGRTVHHLHVHVIPRHKKDGLRGFFWPRQKYESDEEAAEFAARVRAAIDAV